MAVTTETFGTLKDGREAHLFTISTSAGSSVTLTDFGAAVVKVIVPDSLGRLGDVVLGFDSLDLYEQELGNFGAVCGRFANRLSRASLPLDRRVYPLTRNDGPNTLHGGAVGFHHKLWDAEIVGEDGVRFTLFSPDGEEGFPGDLTVAVTYRFSEENVLSLDYEAAAGERNTVANLTNHTYFNLKGEGNGDILDHMLRLNASRFLPATNELITTGEMRQVADTPMDFTQAKLIGRDIKEPYPDLINGKGYDSCWVIDGIEKDKLCLAAELSHEGTGRVVKIYTTQPGVQVYTGNWLSGCPKGKNGHIYEDYSGVALECQALPDSPNKPNFPSTFLRSGEEYNETIIFKFSIL